MRNTIFGIKQLRTRAEKMNVVKYVTQCTILTRKKGEEIIHKISLSCRPKEKPYVSFKLEVSSI